VSNTRGEFTGGAGMIQPEQIGHEDEIQQQWMIKATNPGSTAADGQPIAENVNRGTMPWTEPAVPIEDKPQTVGQGGSLS
jgi:hypothetical protein